MPAMKGRGRCSLITGAASIVAGRGCALAWRRADLVASAATAADRRRVLRALFLRGLLAAIQPSASTSASRQNRQHLCNGATFRSNDRRGSSHARVQPDSAHAICSLEVAAHVGRELRVGRMIRGLHAYDLRFERVNVLVHVLDELEFGLARPHYEDLADIGQ